MPLVVKLPTAVFKADITQYLCAKHHAYSVSFVKCVKLWVRCEENDVREENVAFYAMQ